MTNQITISKPQLVGSEKQIKWANDCIDIIINAIGEIKVPENATQEQIDRVKNVVDSFFANTKSWEWIDKFKHITEQTPKNVIWSSVMVGWPKIDANGRLS